MIFLVVFGHVIELYREHLNNLYVFLYAFHMPLFIFISGYLAKRVKFSKIINLILLYLLFQSFFNWYRYFLDHYNTFPFHYGIPHFHLWYIVSLGFWYAIALCVSKLKLNTMSKFIFLICLFTIAIISRWYVDIIDMKIGYFYEGFTSNTLSYQRTITFAPFFFVGYFMTQQKFNKICNVFTDVRIKYTVLLVVSLIMFLFIQKYPLIERVFRGSLGSSFFVEPTNTFSFYIVVVIIHYFISFGLSFLIMNIATDRLLPLTKWGDNSLTIFLFHPIFVFWLWEFSFFETWEVDTQLFFFFIVSLGISHILGSIKFVKLTKYICNPYITLISLFKVRNRNPLSLIKKTLSD